MRPNWSVAALSALSLLLPACGGWMSVNRVSSAQKKPNNVWVFLTVDRGKDEPVTDLTADDFSVYEDDKLLPASDGKQLLQSPDSAAALYTMLLVDMSSTARQGKNADELVDAAKAFAARLGKTQRVGVYGFDGEPKLRPMVSFDAAPVSGAVAATGAPAAAYEAMRKYKARDVSSNLNGAVVEALRELRRAMDRDAKPLKLGTLVVFAEGADRAGRVSQSDLRTELDDDKYRLYEVFGVTQGADAYYLRDVARDGSDATSDHAGLKGALDRVAGKIELHAKRYYLLSFCTTARQGEHDVKVEAHTNKPEPRSGATRYTFKAEGLGPPPDCDPKTPAPPELKVQVEEKRETKPRDAPSGSGPAQPPPKLLGPAAPGASP